MVVTDWELAKATPSGNPTKVVELQFFNRTTGAVEYFDAKIPFVATTVGPANSFIPGGLPGVTSKLLAKSASFSIGAIRGSYGVILAQGGWVGSLATVCFSSVSPIIPPGFLAGVFALATIVLSGAPLAGRLSNGVLPFHVD